MLITAKSRQAQGNVGEFVAGGRGSVTIHLLARLLDIVCVLGGMCV